jgi:hypothetical protein
MAGDQDLNREVKKVQRLENALISAERGEPGSSSVEQAQRDLSVEVFGINVQASDAKNPALRKKFVDALTAADAQDAHVPLVTLDGKGEVAVNDKQLESLTMTRLQRDGGDEGAVVQAIQIQRDLLAGGTNSLYDKIVKFNDPHANPDTKDARIDAEAVQNYLDHGNPNEHDRNVLRQLEANFGAIANRIGDAKIDGDGYFINKFAMGVNLTREAGHALIDGGNNSVFNRIAKAKNEDPANAQITSLDIENFLKSHSGDITTEQKEALETLNRRLSGYPLHEGFRDWAIGTIGVVDDFGMHFTKDSITNGINTYGLDSFTVKREKSWWPF